MPDATDLAATLRRRADEVMAEARERAGQGEIVHDAIVGLWAVEDVQPIAAALERGAAAERVVAASSVDEGEDPYSKDAQWEAAHDAYGALTEGKST